MPIPRGVPLVQAALIAFELPARPEEVAAEAWDEVAAKLDAARMQRSVVPQVIAVLDVLGPHAALLDAAGVSLLIGSTELIIENGFGGRAGDALGVRDIAVARLATFPPEASPLSPMPGGGG